MILIIEDMLNKYKEIIMYFIFGVLTTLVNIALFYILNISLFGSFDYIVASLIAWVGSVLFAFYTNKYYVFNSFGKEKVIKEIISFFSLRLVSLIFDLLIMYILIDIISIDDLISKIVANIVVVIVNYIFSKLYIFNK